MIVVEGVNVKKKTVQPKPGTEEKGQIVQTESPIHHSNAMLYSKEKQIRSRVGHKCAQVWIFRQFGKSHACSGADCVRLPHRLTDDGKKVRYLLKTGEVLDS